MESITPYRTNRQAHVHGNLRSPLAQDIQKADEFLRANAINKLQVIAEQVRRLQEQARIVLRESRRDMDLHHAACNFRKIPGTIYHLYRRPSGQTYFSLLSAHEWGASCPHEYLGSYKLQYDMSWTPEEKVEEKEKELNILNNIMTAQFAITDSSGPNIDSLVQDC
ncbi:PREDICTED: uncharacterized protein C1orf50 homolog [Priapulus caudatus]|uniref:Uncharacterized protein C1orf50 homolog n=1 Tax=Priapulus caudatus TaxID=37621 RepID=A0ABM1EZW6_PRICU|nr:PREDICTED: uncharacterized protein C1orf50 homolog [Priapulus caudatus]